MAADHGGKTTAWAWRTALALALALAAVAWSPGVGRANPLFELLGAPLAPGSLNARALGAGTAATYFNPALLPAQGGRVDVGLSILATQLSIDLDARPPEADVPGGVYETTAPRRPLATADAPPRGVDAGMDAQATLLVGVSRPVWGRHLVFGFYGALPLSAFQAAQPRFPDEREQYFSNHLAFTRLGDRLDRAAFALALGGDITPWLSLGAGFTLGFETTVSSGVFLPDTTNQADVIVSPSMETTAELVPQLAVAVRPNPCLDVSVVAHFPTRDEVRGENLVQLWSPDAPIPQSYVTASGYEPLSVALAGAWTAARGPHATLRLAGQAVWRGWSKYTSRHFEAPRDPWSDTVTVSAGAVGRLGALRLWGDVLYEPSPVPDQVGRESFVDNDRLGFGVGVETRANVLGARLFGGLHLAAHYLVPRHARKDPAAPHPVVDELPDDATNVFTAEPVAGARGLQSNSPGYPGFGSSGWLLAATLSLRVPL